MAILTPYTFADLISFTRSTTTTCFDSSGAMTLVPINEPAYDHDPATLAPLGMGSWEARTNIFLNSLLDGTNLATQTVTVTAVARTISFHGTGTITLSGAHTAVITGSSATTRTELTFTPSAGSLIATVVGQVKWANCEAGDFATPFIPTGASQVTRVADAAVIAGANFSSWFNKSEGTFVVEFEEVKLGGHILMATDDSGANSLRVRMLGGVGNLQTNTVIYTGGVNTAQIYDTTSLNAQIVRLAASYKNGAISVRSNGGSAANIYSDSTSITTPILADRLYIGSYLGTAAFANGVIKSIAYYPTRLTNAQLVTLST